MAVFVAKQLVLDVEDPNSKDYKRKVLKELEKAKVVVASSIGRKVCLLVSDHRSCADAKRLLALKQRDERLIQRLPSILREAVQKNIQIEPFSSFRANLSVWICRFSSQQNEFQKLSAAPKKHSEEEDLGPSFIKYQHIGLSYRPEAQKLVEDPIISFVEDRHLSNRRRRGKKPRQKPAVESDDIQILESDDDSGGPKLSERECKKNTKYCFRCENSVDNMENHLEGADHLRTIGAKGYFQRIDQLCKGLGLDEFFANEAKKDAEVASSSQTEKTACAGLEEATLVEDDDEDLEILDAEDEIESDQIEYSPRFVTLVEEDKQCCSEEMIMPSEVLERGSELYNNPMVPFDEIVKVGLSIKLAQKELKFLEMSLKSPNMNYAQDFMSNIPMELYLARYGSLATGVQLHLQSKGIETQEQLHLNQLKESKRRMKRHCREIRQLKILASSILI